MWSIQVAKYRGGWNVGKGWQERMQRDGRGRDRQSAFLGHQLIVTWFSKIIFDA